MGGKCFIRTRFSHRGFGKSDVNKGKIKDGSKLAKVLL